MACNCDYLNPTESEKESRRACLCLKYILTELDIPVAMWIHQGASEKYGNPEWLNESVVLLCTICTNLTEELRDKLIYDNKNPSARMLADWWDEHKVADQIREFKQLNRIRQELNGGKDWRKGETQQNLFSCFAQLVQEGMSEEQAFNFMRSFTQTIKNEHASD